MPVSSLNDHALRRLLDAGRSVVSEVDTEAILDRVLMTAAEVTGARYAALGVLDEDRSGLARLLSHGLSPEIRARLGQPPRGHGLVGALITDPRPLRLDSIADDPRSVGFPSDHPGMRTFLGVPILIGDEAWGNLYLCDKHGGEPFTADDEAAVVALAEWAAIALENARLLESSERRSVELQRAVHRLEASSAIARALGGETDLDRILELIVDRGRGLIDARGLLILLRRSGGLVVAARSGQVPADIGRGDAVPDALGLADDGATLVPLAYRGQSLGILVIFGGGAGDEDQLMLQSFAASAATAVATARTVEEQRLRDAMRAAEEERKRWARELHDETLQGLGGLRMLLTAATRGSDPDRLREGVTSAIRQLEGEIDALRGLIRELRPAALDELGPAAAIEGLASRLSERSGIAVTALVRLADERYAPEVETALYRIVQEAVTNAVRHSGAQRVTIDVSGHAGTLEIRVCDDGQGFDPAGTRDGFGLIGMRERVALLNGELAIASSPDGTTITALVPVP
jgi:signal transduction histidine kinase